MLDEGLPSETGIHRHDQHEIELVEHVVEPLQGGRRIKCETGATAAVVDQANGAVDVLRRLGVKRDDVCAGLGKIGNDGIHRRHHKVHVDRNVHQRTNRRAHHRTDGQIRHVMVVHHVEMDEVGAGRHHTLHLRAEASEIGRENARCDARLHSRAASEPESRVAVS